MRLLPKSKSMPAIQPKIVEFPRPHLKAKHQTVMARTTTCDAATLQALWEEHVDTEFTTKSADAAVATMIPTASVNHVPVMTGGQGTEGLRHFYANHFIPKMPADTHMTPTHRTVAQDTIVDEFTLSCTHDIEMDWMLPGLAPTGKQFSVPFVVVIQFEGDKVSTCRNLARSCANDRVMHALHNCHAHLMLAMWYTRYHS